MMNFFEDFEIVDPFNDLKMRIQNTFGTINILLEELNSLDKTLEVTEDATERDLLRKEIQENILFVIARKEYLNDLFEKVKKYR